MRKHEGEKMWNIQLQTAAFNQWLDETEEKLTRMGDTFDVIETEVEQLNKVWESGAGEIWKKELQVHVSEARAGIEEIEKMVYSLLNAGKELADLESKTIAAAEKL